MHTDATGGARVKGGSAQVSTVVAHGRMVFRDPVVQSTRQTLALVHGHGVRVEVFGTCAFFWYIGEPTEVENAVQSETRYSK